MSINSNEEIRNQEVSAANGTNDSIPLFLLKTYQILENPNYSEIISWTKNGEGFVVKKVKDFAQKILPFHFRHNNYTSFVRQLNMYDFHKTRQQNQQNAFKNSMFKKGFRHLLKEIQRKDYKKNKEPRQPVSAVKVDENSLIEKNNGKESQEIAQNFYRKWNDKLAEPQKKMEQKIAQLAAIQSISAQNKCSLLNLLEFLMETKKVSKESMLVVEEFSKSCECFISTKQAKLSLYGDSQELLKPTEVIKQEGKVQQQPITFPTFRSLAH